MQRGDWMCLGTGMQSHHRTSGPVDLVALTLNADDLARVAFELTGRELIVTPGKILQPPDHLGNRLMSAIEAAINACTVAPRIFTVPRAAHALEATLLRLMVMCLVHGEAREESSPQHRRAAIARKFAAAIEANLDRSLHIPDVCRQIGVPERTLRNLCQEQLGMSPHRFLALRRMHLVRRTLLRADRHSVTVSETIMNYGVWELGRFAGAYKALFGESPSATLLRQAVD